MSDNRKTYDWKERDLVDNNQEKYNKILEDAVEKGLLTEQKATTYR